MDRLAEARRILESTRDVDVQVPPFKLPYNVLDALLQHAPTEAGKLNIAKDIIDNRYNLQSLTEHYYYSLLVPSWSIRIHC